MVDQPEGQTIFSGLNVQLNVAVAGSSPLSYQWRFNGTNLFGITNATLTLTNVQPNQAGIYSVVVSNQGVTAISSNAVLTVITTAINSPQILLRIFKVFGSFDPSLSSAFKN